MADQQRFAIAPFSGQLITVRVGDLLTIVDDEGGQVIDSFAESAADPEEFLSAGVTIDCICAWSLRVDVPVRHRGPQPDPSTQAMPLPVDRRKGPGRMRERSGIAPSPLRIYSVFSPVAKGFRR